MTQPDGMCNTAKVRGATATGRLANPICVGVAVASHSLHIIFRML